MAEPKSYQGKGPKHQLACATVNATSLKALKKFLLKTSANVVFAQETHVCLDEVPEASRWAKQKGWHSLWNPAQPEQRPGSSSGGVAVLTRSYIGLSKPPYGEMVLEPSRLMAAYIEAPGTHGFIGYSGYWYVSEGLSQRNLDLFEKLGRHRDKHPYQWICGADFNMSPQLVASTASRSACRMPFSLTLRDPGATRRSWSSNQVLPKWSKSFRGRGASIQDQRGS